MFTGLITHVGKVSKIKASDKNDTYIGKRAFRTFNPRINLPHTYSETWVNWSIEGNGSKVFKATES